MTRKRNPENKYLPPRWKLTHGAYYYRVPVGQEHKWDGKTKFQLGKTLSEAYLEYGKRIEVKKEVKFIKELLERYRLEVLPEKSKASQKKNEAELDRLIIAFGHMPINTLTPMDVYGYYSERTSKSAAKREIALLSHSFTKAVEWGIIHRHPFKGEVRTKGLAPRTRYIEDWEIDACLALAPNRKDGSVKAIQAYIELKLLTGLRMSDLLRLKVADCKQDGIHVTTGKTGKAVIYTWSDELRRVYNEVIEARPIDIAPYLFCTSRGKCYVNEDGEHSGFSSMWQRFMARMMDKKNPRRLTERFHEHDLRAKVATDATSVEHAQQLLTHADSKTTKRIYIRKAEIVEPAR